MVQGLKHVSLMLKLHREKVSRGIQRSTCERRGNTLRYFVDIYPESHGHNVTSTALYVPYSLDSGAETSATDEEGVGGYENVSYEKNGNHVLARK